MSDNKTEFDFVIYGASGFTGKLVAEYFQQRYSADRDRKWAIAGRDRAKLSAVRDEIGASSDLPIVIASASDPKALHDMASRTRCVISTVGPFQLYGEPLIRTCAELGVDYIDLCGEVPWMREMILEYEETARKSGARILFSCGFDSVPFEAGVFHLQNEALKKFGRPMDRVKSRIRVMNGTFSGGTAESFRATEAAIAEDASLIAILKNSFSLTPGFEGPKQPSGMKIEFDPDVDAWVAPFLMAPINSRNIHRSNALMEHWYGTNFVYDEMRVAGPGDAGAEEASKIASEGAELASDRGPKAGDGPSREERESGNFDILFIGFADGVERIRTSVRGNRDPGYGATSRMIVESAMALRFSDNVAGGIYTPVAALKDRLLERLSANAELIFQVEGN